MAENNPSNGQGDIAQFLEKFKDPNLNTFHLSSEHTAKRERTPSDKSAQFERSFAQLEQKVQELEEKFDASERQNEMILSELAHTREHIERQKDRDAFIEHLSFSIANLRASVENLTRAHQNRSFAFSEPDVQRSFDTVSRPASHADIYQYEPDNYREAQERRRREEQAEKERIISSLHQKASQLKAVNSALDREIKKVQQEKMEALKKSAEQAKEILSLRNQLTEAEERFKSFNFEGRIISIRQEYEQRVSSLETQLKEISDTCMKQVEEIETLRTENIKLQQAAAEKEQALGRLEEKERELQALKDEMLSLQEDNTLQAQNQQAIFSETIRSLETQRDDLTVQLQAAQNELDAVRGEKDQLEKNFQALLAKINSNDAVIEQLKQKIDVLCKQNEELSQHNARLTQEQDDLARKQAQLVQENGALRQQKAQLEEKLKDAPQKPVLPLQAQQPRPLTPKKVIRVPLKPSSASGELPLAVPATAPGAAKPAPQPAAAPVASASSERPAAASAEPETLTESPVEINRQAKAKVQTSADLPEIKVADPVAQPEPVLIDGEDFLEKTDNFIGRIKWSIFREDR